MKSFLKKHFGLTDSGIRAVQRSSTASFLVNVGYMLLMMLAMYIGKNVLAGDIKPLWYYGILIAITLCFVYWVVDLEYVRTYNATYQESAKLRLELADTLKNLPLSYFFRHNLSDVSQTIMQDVADIEHAMSHAMPRIIGYSGFLLAVSILSIVYNPLLGLATFLPLFIGFLLVFLSKGLQRRWTGKYFWRNREMNEAFQETIELQREIKNCGMAEENYKAVSALMDHAEKVRFKSEVSQGIPMLGSMTFIKLTLGIVTLVSAVLLQKNAVELITVIGYLLASVRLVDAVGVMDETMSELFYLDARVKRINSLRETPVQTGEDRVLKHHDIELKHVSFRYHDDAQAVDDVSFVARQNQVTAIVGPSGCGKSTILRLVSRLYDYQQGEILIDGQDIRSVSTDALFDQVSFVFQDVILFNVSVLDNIRLGRADATDEEVRQAARMANCEEFILKLPQGYDSLIGENGGSLSGGERQRLSIARAFLKNAPILLLDEISASLDVENEMKIQGALNRLTPGKTVIIVSHRLKSIEQVHQIVVMDKGRVDAVGTHETLLQTSPLYRRLIEKSRMTEEFAY